MAAQIAYAAARAADERARHEAELTSSNSNINQEESK